MNPRLKKLILLVLAAALLVSSSRIQNSLNRDRNELGLTRVEPLENAPPMLAFTTVALGGFRGLIANMLWIRANDLQQDDKFFEMAQLADWITKLEPHYAQVWIFQEWNMAWNISVKFKDFADRWRWVQRGIQLLRDEGLRYNPNEVMMYRELAWIFQNKMGAVTDDANMYYKQQWANQMADVFGDKTPDLDELIEHKTPDALQRYELLTNKYKLDPKLMKEIDQRYGPLEWRLPESHAIYWAVVGLERAKENPTKVKKDDLINLRRVIYQSLLTDLYRGRLEADPYRKQFDFAPNLDIIPKLNQAYEDAYAAETGAGEKTSVETAHRNAIASAVYFLYVNNRMAEAAKWYKYLGEKYPDKPLLTSTTNSLPRQLTLDQFAVARVQEDVNELNPDWLRSAIQGLLRSSYHALILGQDERAAGYRLLAQKVWDNYNDKLPPDRLPALRLPPVNELARQVLNEMLNPTNGVPPEARAVLLTKLGMSGDSAVPQGSATNAPANPTNAPAK